jgi:hypothetical protein
VTWAEANEWTRAFYAYYSCCDAAQFRNPVTSWVKRVGLSARPPRLLLLQSRPNHLRSALHVEQRQGDYPLTVRFSESAVALLKSVEPSITIDNHWALIILADVNRNVNLRPIVDHGPANNLHR